jgi:hypothetical protein
VTTTLGKKITVNRHSSITFMVYDRYPCHTHCFSGIGELGGTDAPARHGRLCIT